MKPFDERVDKEGFLIVEGGHTIISTIDAWFNGDGHTKRREPREKELTEFAKKIIRQGETDGNINHFA